MKRVSGTLLLHAAVLLAALLTLAPLIWMLFASVMPSGESTTLPPPLIPHHVTFQHYVELFTRLDLGRCLMNSTLIAVITTLVSVILNGAAGYTFAKLRFRGRDRLFRTLLIALMIPAQVGMLPLFLELKALHLVNTLAGAMVPYLTSVFGIFMVRQYALSIPDDLLDAARLDGASELRIFWFIVLPVIRPILVTQGIFNLLASWNDFLWPLIVLSDERHFTLPLALANLVGEHVQDTELMMAGAVLTVLPVLVVFFCLQRLYIRGVMMGSTKG
ncbi:MAG TPA: carbohydrate ABC transporter permease [Candidatus Udaeobacter sp.]|jgi:multiple sugar transport system permease protein|nr:carbohydrate ABC transporter permease [Candidatus Udaeobacter sp.]